MADNYLEKQYEEYLARKEAVKKTTKGTKAKSKSTKFSAVNNAHRSEMREDYKD